jgi:hypothetical protein
MDSVERDVATSVEAQRLAKWERPQVRRLVAGMAEGSKGFGPLDPAFAS